MEKNKMPPEYVPDPTEDPDDSLLSEDDSDDSILDVLPEFRIKTMTADEFICTECHLILYQSLKNGDGRCLDCEFLSQ